MVVKRTNRYAIRASKPTRQSAVFILNQCEKRNPVHQRFDVRNWDGAVDTTLLLKSFCYEIATDTSIVFTVQQCEHFIKSINFTS